MAGKPVLNASSISHADGERVALITANLVDRDLGSASEDIEAYMTRGDEQLSIENYGKFLVINPQNDNGREISKRSKESK